MFNTRNNVELPRIITFGKEGFWKHPELYKNVFTDGMFRSANLLFSQTYAILMARNGFFYSARTAYWEVALPIDFTSAAPGAFSSFCNRKHCRAVSR